MCPAPLSVVTIWKRFYKCHFYSNSPHKHLMRWRWAANRSQCLPQPSRAIWMLRFFLSPFFSLTHQPCLLFCIVHSYSCSTFRCFCCYYTVLSYFLYFNSTLSLRLCHQRGFVLIWKYFLAICMTYIKLL